MSKIVTPIPAEIENAAHLIRSGELVAFPTETVYGIGADALNVDAVKKIYAAKGRPSNNPLILHCADLDSLLSLIDPSAPSTVIAAVKKLSSLWPGPLTVVVPKRADIPDEVTGGSSTVGLRIPNHETALKLLAACGTPLAAPSANPSNYISPTTAQHVADQLGESVKIILNGGSTLVGLESTVVSLLDPENPVILRPGAISETEISRCLGIPLSAVHHHQEAKGENLLSPGLLDTHYAPRTKLAFLKDVDIWSLPLQRTGLIAFSEGLNLNFDFHAISVLSPNNNLNEVASGLFAALREMDSLNLDLILIDSCIESGIGHAIMDRLKRAVTKRR